MINVHDGSNRSEKICQMLNEKLRKQLEKDLPKLVKNNEELGQALDEYLILQGDAERAKERLAKIGNPMCIEYSEYRKSFEVKYTANLVPPTTLKKLQKANNLCELGKRSEAQKIWDEIVKEHGLLE